MNGQLRAKLSVPASASDDEIKQQAVEAVARYAEAREVRKVILATGKRGGKLVNVVVP